MFFFFSILCIIVNFVYTSLNNILSSIALGFNDQIPIILRSNLMFWFDNA